MLPQESLRATQEGSQELDETGGQGVFKGGNAQLRRRSQEVEKDATVNAPLGAPTGRRGLDQVVPGERAGERAGAKLGKEQDLRQVSWGEAGRGEAVHAVGEAGGSSTGTSASALLRAPLTAGLGPLGGTQPTPHRVWAASGKARWCSTC